MKKTSTKRRTVIAVPGLEASSFPKRKRLPVGEKTRPRYALEGHEDEVYHELRMGARGTAPEYCAFLNQSWTFNRSMRWTTAPHGTLICHEDGGNLRLTGVHRVSDWFSDPVNTIEHRGDSTRFVRKSARRRDCVALPALQFNLEQHPRVVLKVDDVDADWQLCVLVKGRSGPPLLSSGWERGPKTVRLDLASELRRRGFRLHFVELHFVLGLWSPLPGKSSEAVFSMEMPGRAAMVPCLPVIRSCQTAAARGVPLSAMVVDETGKLLRSPFARVHALIGGHRIPLSERKGIWSATVRSLGRGTHEGKLYAEGAVKVRSRFTLTVTDGKFVSYDHRRRSLVRSGQALGPLSGSYQGIVFFRNAGRRGEAIVQGQKDWTAWHRKAPMDEHWHYWEALTEGELGKRFGYLEVCGWDLIHLSQHWGIWEKLDAGGRIAPHGAEQLALVLRVAGRHGLGLQQALSHYPYSSDFTPPWRQYLEDGYRDTDWKNPRRPFTRRFHQYLRDFATLFREETTLVAMSTSGEGDIAAGPARVNDTFRFMASVDPNHLFVAEPANRTPMPQKHVRGWKPSLYGSRMYWIGEKLDPEIDLGVEFKFMGMSPFFMGEGSWSCPHLYSRFMGSKTWAGTPRYRRRLRDSLYLGLVHRSPILLTWEEQYAEDERIIFRRIRDAVDWGQRFMEPPVALRVDDSCVIDRRAVLGQYESFFSALPLATQYLPPDRAPGPSVRAVIDTRRPYVEPRFVSKRGRLTEDLKSLMPLRVSPGYRASYLWSADRRTLLAYIYNCTGHERHQSERDLSRNLHRAPRPAALELCVQNLPPFLLECRVFDLDEKSCIERRVVEKRGVFSFARSTHDYFLLLAPKPPEFREPCSSGKGSRGVFFKTR